MGKQLKPVVNKIEYTNQILNNIKIELQTSEEKHVKHESRISKLNKILEFQNQKLIKNNLIILRRKTKEKTFLLTIYNWTISAFGNLTK